MRDNWSQTAELNGLLTYSAKNVTVYIMCNFCWCKLTELKNDILDNVLYYLFIYCFYLLFIYYFTVLNLFGAE